MAMFERVAEHVVASSGAKTLHPVADINSAERYKTLCIVQRKKSFWFWKNPSMVPTFVRLNDMLLEKGTDLAAKEEQFTLMKKFQDKPDFNLNGSLDIASSLAKKIAAQANIKMEADDKLELVVNLGDIIKCEVPYKDLQEAMTSSPINIAHPLYVEAARQSPKSSLCVVIEELSTKDDGSVSGEGEKKISVVGEAKAGPNNVQVNVKCAGSAESTFKRSYTIPPNTPLAYGCIEFGVDANGTITLHDMEDTLDDSIAKLELPDDPFEKIQNQLAPLINSNHIQKYQDEIKAMLSDATETDFRVMHILFYYANSDSTMSIAHLKHLLGADIPYTWKQFMHPFGFSIHKDAKNGDSIKFPTKMESTNQKACLALVDSILDCHKKNWKELPSISNEHTQILMKIIQNEVRDKTNSMSDEDVAMMIRHDPLTEQVLETCGFKKSDGNVLTYTGNNSYELLDVYAIMHFLSSGHTRHCCLF